MQIQLQNTNQPNFQAIKLNTITKGARRIDIYSLRTQDKSFADKMLNAAKSQSFPEDSRLLGGETVRGVYDEALKKVGKLGKYAHDRVLLAIENGKKITGIMNITDGGDLYTKGLAVWNNDQLTRDSLVVSALKDTSSTWNDICAFILPTAGKSSAVKCYFRRLGFRTPREFGNKDLLVDGDKLSEIIPQAEKALGAQIKTYSRLCSTNLSRLFDIEG